MTSQQSEHSQAQTVTAEGGAAGDGTALVTGGTGFVGRHLVRRLLDRGRPVRTCGRGPRPRALNGAVDHWQVDLAAGPLPDRLLRGVTEVFHLAGASSSTASGPEEMRQTNVEGTEHLLSAAYGAGVRRMVHMSTSSVYGKQVQLPQPVPEGVECHPGPGYAESKWAAEQVCWAYADKGMEVAVLRPATVYGPGAVKLVASTILDAAIERYAGLDTFAIPAEPVELRLVHVDDVVDACLHLAGHDNAPGRAFNLVSGVYPSSHEVAAAVAEELGLELELSEEPDPGLSYGRRAEVHEKMLAAGMRDGIMLKEKRIRFLKKSNPNNRLSLAALASTGFVPERTRVAEHIAESVRWYTERRWIL